MTYDPNTGDQTVANSVTNADKNKKTLKWVGIGVGVVVVLALIGGGGSSPKHNNGGGGNYTPDTSYTQPTSNPSADYANWKSNFAPIFATLISDYQATITDLGNADMASSRMDFVSLSQDAIDMSSNADSPDANLNYAVQQLSTDVGVLAGEGEQSLNNIDMGGSPTQGFTDACNAVGADIQALNDALTSANATY